MGKIASFRPMPVEPSTKIIVSFVDSKFLHQVLELLGLGDGLKLLHTTVREVCLYRGETGTAEMVKGLPIEIFTGQPDSA